MADDLACLYRRDGFGGVVRRLGGRLARAVYARDDHLILRKDLTEVEPAADGAFRLERAGERHLPLVASFNAKRCYRRATNAFRDRLARGYIGLIAVRDGQMVGWIWCADADRHPHDAEVQRYRVPAADVYGFDLILAEEHRGQGNATALLEQIHAELASLGYHAMWGYVESDNVPSRWLFSICGHDVVGRSRGRRILSRLLIVDRRIYLQGRRGLRPLLGR